MNDIRRYRKMQNSLVVSGTGVVALGFWSILKGILYAIYRPEYYNEIVKLIGEDTENTRVVLYITIFLFLGIDLLVRIYIGKRSKSEGIGRKTSSIYILLSGMELAVNLYGLIDGVISGNLYMLGDFISSLVLDMISSYFFINVIICGIWLRRYKRLINS